MRVDDLIRKTVVYVGDANGKPFVPHGTGFIVATFIGELAYQSVVTAKHVIDGIGPDIHIRLNRLDGLAQVIATEGSAWRTHPNTSVDIATCPTLIPKDQFDIQHIDLDHDMKILDYRGPDAVFGIGDEVMVAGMFQQHLGQARNLPIVRVGAVAAMPEEKIQTLYGHHEAFLVEVHSIDGLSGSPVFVANSFMRVMNRVLAPTPKLHFGFLGILLGTDEVVNHKDFVRETDEGLVRNLLNTGIGIVAPADLVSETVKHPEIQTRREEAAAKAKEERRFRPTSVAAESPAADANPRHKEDFTSLLDAATRGNKSTDRT